MSLSDVVNWLNQHWPLIGGLLTFLVAFVGIWLTWSRERRETRAERAKCQRLISEADNLTVRAYKLLEPFALRSDEDMTNDEEPESILFDAINRYREAIELSKSSKEKAKLLVKIAEAYAKTNLLNQAEEYLIAAIAFQKKHPIAWFRLAIVQRGLLKSEEALSSIKRHLKIKPNDTEARSLLQDWQREQLKIVEPRVKLKERYLMPKIFLSYSHHDEDNVNLLAQQLKLHGLRLWRDVEDLTLGTQTPEQIRQILATECQGCLLYLTPNSLKSDFVMKIELKEAMERLGADKNFALIPLFHGVTIDEARAAVPTYASRDIANLHGILIPADATAEQIRSKFTEAAQRLLPTLLEKSRPDFAADPNRKLILDLHTRHYMYREPQPDLDLDWRPFIQSDDTIDATVCAQTLWPALQAIEKSTAKALGPRQLLIRASAHLSCGVALGFAFGATTRYQLEIEQPIPGQDPQLWSTINPQPAKSPLLTDSNEIDVSSDEVTLELSVSQPVTAVVDKWVDQRKKEGRRVRARVAIKPPVGSISHTVGNSAEANAIAQQVADEFVALQSKFQPRVVHLFMAAPLALAVLIGYRMNARGVIQLYELRKSDQNYVPSFRLV